MAPEWSEFMRNITDIMSICGSGIEAARAIPSGRGSERLYSKCQERGIVAEISCIASQ
jgi:hypothetical protein